jgi:hypothetical protein
MHPIGLWLEDEFQEVATKNNFWKLCVRVMIAAHLNLELTTLKQGSTSSAGWQKGRNWRGAYRTHVQQQIMKYFAC